MFLVYYCLIKKIYLFSNENYMYVKYNKNNCVMLSFLFEKCVFLY